MIMSRAQSRHELLRCRLNRSPFPALFDWEKGAREVEGNFCASLRLVLGGQEYERVVVDARVDEVALLRVRR